MDCEYGNKIDRDINAAKNIYCLGQAMLEKKSNMNCVVKQQYRKLSSLGESSSPKAEIFFRLISFKKTGCKTTLNCMNEILWLLAIIKKQLIYNAAKIIDLFHFQILVRQLIMKLL